MIRGIHPSHILHFIFEIGIREIRPNDRMGVKLKLSRTPLGDQKGECCAQWLRLKRLSKPFEG